MAVGKVAPTPALDVCASSAACRVALESTVERFTEAVSAATPAAIRRRIRKAKGLDLAPDLVQAASPVNIDVSTLEKASPKARK
jgi:hypothetical protein